MHSCSNHSPPPVLPTHAITKSGIFCFHISCESKTKVASQTFQASDWEPRMWWSLHQRSCSTGTWPVGFFCLATVWLNQFRARSANSGSKLAEFEAAIITQYSRSLLLLIFSAKNRFSSTALLCYVVTDHHPQECWHWTTHTHQWDQGFFSRTAS